MYDNDYLEKILGEQYNMSNYFENTYTEPNSIIENSSIDNIKDADDDIKDTDEKIEKKIKNVAKDVKDKKSQENKNVENDKEDIVEDKAQQSENMENVEMLNLDEFYPETYNVINPIVELVVKNNIDKEISEDLINSLTDKIYYAVEADTNHEKKTNLTKDNTIMVNTRPHNSFLHDLIKILILNNILKDRPQKPNRPMPPHHHNNGNRPPIRPIPRYHDIPFPEDQ